MTLDQTHWNIDLPKNNPLYAVWMEHVYFGFIAMKQYFRVSMHVTSMPTRFTTYQEWRRQLEAEGGGARTKETDAVATLSD